MGVWHRSSCAGFRRDNGARLGYERLEARHLLSAVSGDFNVDDHVDGSDLVAWQSGFGTQYDGADFLKWQRNVAYEAPAQTAAELVGAGVNNGGLSLGGGSSPVVSPWTSGIASGTMPTPGLMLENNRQGSDGGDWLLHTSDGSGASPAHNIYYYQSFAPPGGSGLYDIDVSGFTKASASWWQNENWNWVQEAHIELWVDGTKVWSGSSSNNGGPSQRNQWVFQEHSGQYQVNSSIAVYLRSIKGNDNFGAGALGAIYAVSRWDDIRLEAALVSETPDPPTYPAGTSLWTTVSLNLRSSPVVQAGNIIGVLPNKTPLTVAANSQGVTEQLSWVHVQATLNGQPVTGWVHSDYVTSVAPADDDGRFMNSITNQPHNFIGGNYTDLGLVGAGYRTFSSAQAAADLDRLASKGVTHVRIWATGLPEGGLLNENSAAGRQAAADRVGVVAGLAAARAMEITVDLWNPGLGVAHYQSEETKFNNLLSTIVGGNAHHDNIIWSPGNEIGDPANPAGFAAWFTEKAAVIRQTAGPDTRVSAELLPGSVNHPWASPAYVVAAQSVVAAADLVSVHYYPTAAPAQSSGDWDWQSIQLWRQYAQTAGKAFIIGEFSMHIDLRTDAALQQWLLTFESIGVQNVSFWQFMKVGVGHLDGHSCDLVLPGRDVSGFLGANGWLFKAPPA
jgi:hypothetical protein